jgi:hypothetical protein
VEAFLTEGLAGHCEYFATGMVVLARSLGIPARLVNGFAGGRENRIGGFVELRRSDAHSWVEVHYARAGWVAYDPTPPDRRALQTAALSLRGRAAELASALELWWYQRVVGFDRSDQIATLKRAWLAWQGENGPDEGVERAPERAWAAIRPGVEGWQRAALALAALGAAGLLGLRRRRLGAGSGVPRAYRDALRLLARRGLVREPGATARGFARRVALERPGGAALAFDALTESYLAERFGGRRPSAGEAELGALRRGLRRGRASGGERRGRRGASAAGAALVVENRPEHLPAFARGLEREPHGLLGRGRVQLQRAGARPSELAHVHPVAPGRAGRRRLSSRGLLRGLVEVQSGAHRLLLRDGELREDRRQEGEVALGRIRDAQAEAPLRHRGEPRRHYLHPRDLRLDAQGLALAGYAELERHGIAGTGLGAHLDEDAAGGEIQDHAPEALAPHDEPAGQAPSGALRHPSHGMSPPSHGLRPAGAKPLGPT